MQRLLIVSNRLPINVSKGESNEKWKFQMSSGGLVSALAGVQKTMEFVWIGWPGIEVDENDKSSLSEMLLNEHSSLPVFIDQHTSNLHYNGFSNSTIWPLFHYLSADISIDEDQWQGYKKANQIFADFIETIAQDGDIIWVHDYHLMLLPEMLRKKFENTEKNVKIGFFLHIPFPTSEVYRVLPYRKEVLIGILNADLVGFHTYDYSRHFLTSCTRILGSNTSPTSVDFDSRTVKVGAYPVGVEPEKFEEALKNELTGSRIKELEQKYAGLKVIIGVERLDYIKGLMQKLLAYEEFLEQNPDFIGKVILVQIAIPSRTDVVEYQKLQNQVFELVGRINGKFSTLNYAPVQFIYNSISFLELVALYRIADVCLVTSTRDGMNLVACEYVAAQVGKKGSLILSEFAGCAQSLNGAILINPWNLTEIKNSIKTALTSSEAQKISDHSHLLSYVKKFTSSHWGKTFASDLTLSGNSDSNLVQIPILNFDSILTISGIENALIITKSSENIRTIYEICKNTDKKNNLVLYSTNIKSSFDNYDNTIAEIIAESGLWLRSQNSTEWLKIVNESTFSQQITNWSGQLLNILQFYSSRVPYSRIEVSDELISWKFEGSERNFFEWVSSELQMNLEKFIGHLPLKVQRTETDLRIMHSATNFIKIAATAVKFLLANNNFEKVIFIDENDSEFRKIAEILLNDGLSDINICKL